MRLELTGRHIDITPAIRTLVQRAVAQALRKLNDSAVSAHVVLTRQKSRVHAEITLHARGVHFLHAEATGQDLASAVNAAADKVDRQAERLKGKWTARARTGRAPRPAPRAAAASAPPPGPRVIRRRSVVKRMSVDDAAASLAAEGVVVFRNASTEKIAVLFRRPDGNLGLIEPLA